MRKQIEVEIKVGIFVLFGLGLIMLSILVLGGNTLLSSSNSYSAHFDSVDGLVVGAKVTLGGVPLGTVDAVGIDYEKRNIKIAFSVERKSMEWIREDSTVEIATQGVLGDKYLSVNIGSKNLPALPAGADLPTRTSQDLSQFLSQGDQLLVSLNKVANSLGRILNNFEADHRSEIFFKGIATSARNLSLATEKLNYELDELHLKKAIGNLNQIFEKVNNGTGTIGALINDPGLYDQAKALLGGANRNRIIRNLVRQTIKDSEERSSAADEDSKK